MYLYDDLASLTAAFVMMSQETRVTSAMITNAGIETKAAKRNPGSNSLVEVCALELRGARIDALEILGFLKLHSENTANTFTGLTQQTFEAAHPSVYGNALKY